MSIRALWIVSAPDKTGEWKIVFTRKFPTVEKRIKQSHADSYVEIPRKQEVILESLLEQLGIGKKANVFSESRDSCKHVRPVPVLKLPTTSDKTSYLWPVIVVEHYGHLVCALVHEEEKIPSIKNSGDISQSLILYPSVSQGFSTILGIIGFLGVLPNTFSAMHPKLKELDTYISQVLPFGKPNENEPSVVRSYLQNPSIRMEEYSELPAQKPVPSPGWKQGSRPSLNFNITEHVRCAQFNKLNVPDTVEVYGTISCKTEFGICVPEISLGIFHEDAMQQLPFKLVTVHPCVTHLSIDNIEAGSTTQKLRFFPTLDSFSLCNYIMKSDNKVPMFGVFKLRNNNAMADILLQIKLNENIRNNFDYCDVLIPIPNQYQVSSMDLKPTWGSAIAGSKHITWKIGQKFPGRTLEVSLTGNFRLKKAKAKVTDTDSQKCKIPMPDYVEILFKISNYTFSGCIIDAKNIQSSGVSKLKVSCEREFLTVDFKIWNSQENIPVTFTES